MTGRARDVAQELLRGRVAADPGLLRLRLASRATLAVALSSAVLHQVGPAVGLPAVVAMLLGGMVGLQGAFATSSRVPRDVLVTLCGFPLAAAAGALPPTLAGRHRTVHLVGFVVVMVAAVYVRRLGPRWFNYGMLAWFAYFFATFLALPLARLPALLAVVVAATLCLAVVAVLLPDRPEAVLAAARRSFRARAAGLARTAERVVAGELPSERIAVRLHADGFRLVEAALVLDGQLAAADRAEASALRRRLVAAELAAEELAGAVVRLTPARLPPGLRSELVTSLRQLRAGACPAAGDAARSVLAQAEAAADQQEALRDVARAVLRLAEALERPLGPPRDGVEEYEPAVALFLGNLPGTAPSVADLVAGSRSGWSLNTRLCVQTAVAAPLALVVGQQLSPSRYYWAVLACFLVLTGTFTTGEAAVKGLNRVVGTLAGLGAATLAVHLSGGSDAVVVTVLLGCVFVGLYFFRVSYAVMTFAVTTVMGELYEVLHEFSDRLLLLRLAETTVGAAAAVLVVLVVLPVRTADARSAAQAALLTELAALLADVAERLRLPRRTGDLLLDTRRVDARLHQLALVSRPAAGAALAGLATRAALEAVGGWTALAHRARALAAAVVAVEPGSLPMLVEPVEVLRRRCLGEPPAPAPGAVVADAAPDPAAGAVRRRLAELDRTLDAVAPPRIREPVTV